MKRILSIFFIFIVASCSWINDDEGECPYGFWLNLHYTYNILDVEAAPEYIKEVSIYIYDAAGNYVTRLDVNKAELDAKGHRVRVDGLSEGDYQFVVWSGISNNDYAVSGDVGTMDKFRLSLANLTTNIKSQLPDLYYGYLSTVHYADTYLEHDVYMMKNTNQLSCLVVPSTQGVTINPANYNMKVVSANTTMDVNNNLTSSTLMTYEPFVKEAVTINDSEYGPLDGIRFSISTLRLMEKTDCRIILENKETGNQVFNVSLPAYIGAVGELYTNLGKTLSVQEYLDRQDFYTIVFFLSADLNSLFQMNVNSWRVRANNHLKL